MPELSALQLIIGFLILLTPVVFFHELGHYWVARRAGVIVEVFSVGFGPEIYGWTSKKTGTRWRIAAIPLGGYVRMRGDENEASGSAPDAGKVSGSFAGASLGWRSAIVLAGPVANFILGILLFALVYMTVGKVTIPAKIGEVMPETAAAEAGLQPGDLVTDIDGMTVRDLSDLQSLVLGAPGRPLEFTIFRDGISATLIVTPRQKFDEKMKIYVGDLGDRPTMPAEIGEVMPETAAAKAGIQPGDLVIDVDGITVRDFSDLRGLVVEAPGRLLRLTVIRDGRPITLNVTPQQKFDEETKVYVGLLGVKARGLGTRERLLPGSALVAATSDAFHWSVVILRGLSRLVRFQTQPGEVGGPVRIAEMSGSALQQGIIPFLLFTAIISINLGLFNLLPIPALDGGHLCFFLYEALFRRPMPLFIQGMLLRFGILMLMVLMFVFTVIDVERWFD